MTQHLLSCLAAVAALAVAGCGSSSTPNDDASTVAPATTRTIVQTVTTPAETTPEPEALTPDDEAVFAAANLAASRYCVAALGHVVGDLPNPPSDAVIDRHVKTANRAIEVIDAKPEVARDAARELIRVSQRCQSPVAGDVRRALR